MPKSALVAMSGGVDSSVTAYLMMQDGYDCHGGTMSLYENETDIHSKKNCCNARNIEDAYLVSRKLGIDHTALELSGDFEKYVIEPFISSYECGDTPNPCIECNRFLKFGSLMRYADEKGYDIIATGHYALTGFDEKSGRYFLKRAKDLTKDQSYVLYAMTQQELKRVRFPLGGLTKDETRKIAEEQGFVNAKKQESQDICFVPDGDYVSFMERYTGKQYPPGDFLDEDGNVIGRHKGAVRYTIGQRKGLGISAAHPLFVFEKDMEKNTVSVGREERVFSTEFTVRELNVIMEERLTEKKRLSVMTRYRGPEKTAVIEPLSDDSCRVVFDEPARAITPGQAAVFYDGDFVYGGGKIV